MKPNKEPTMTTEKPKNTPEPKVGTITPLIGEWIAKCCVCGKQYAQHCGSTPCCGSVAQIIANDEEYSLPTAAALRQAREALETISKMHDGECPVYEHRGLDCKCHAEIARAALAKLLAPQENQPDASALAKAAIANAEGRSL